MCTIRWTKGPPAGPRSGGRRSPVGTTDAHAARPLGRRWGGAGMWGAYARLGASLAGRARAGVDEGTLTFAQVAALVGHPVPPPAQTRAAWWRTVTEPHDAASSPW